MTETLAPTKGTDQYGNPWGAVNVWDLYGLEYAREIPCNRIETFFHLFYSKGTRAAIANPYHVGEGYAHFKLFGPITDDALEEGRKLTSEEAEGKRKFEGFEAGACLTARFQVFRPGVLLRLTTQEEQDAFVERLRKLRLSGHPLEMACKSLGVRRVK